MDADDLDEALSDLGVSSIHSSPPAEEMADGSSNANIGVVPLVASSANLNQVATNTNVKMTAARRVRCCGRRGSSFFLYPATIAGASIYE